MLEPGVEEVVAATYAECAGFGGSGEGDLLYLAGEFWCWPFICIRDEDPRMLELDGGESGVAVSCVVVEGSGVDVSASCAGDLDCRVCGVGVEDVDVVGPCDAGETAWEIALFVARENQDGDHLLAMVSRGSAELCSGKSNGRAAGLVRVIRAETIISALITAVD